MVCFGFGFGGVDLDVGVVGVEVDVEVLEGCFEFDLVEVFVIIYDVFCVDIVC